MYQRRLPVPSATVLTTVDVLFTPPPVRQRTDVSESHSVDSHAASPARAFSVYVVRPKLLPCTVTLADPVPARFTPVYYTHLRAHAPVLDLVRRLLLEKNNN